MNQPLPIHDICNKNEILFKKLFEQFYGKLVAYAWGFVCDKQIAEEIVQESFIYLWENGSNLTITTSINGYLYAMVRNRCLNYLKSLKITDSYGILHLQDLTADTPPFDENTEHSKHVLSGKLLLVLKKLPNKMQSIVRLRFFENYSYKEIGKELGISINTVKTQLKRAKIKLAQSLSEIKIF